MSGRRVRLSVCRAEATAAALRPDVTSPVARWAGPLLCALAFLGMAAVSWRKWPDLLVDFGHELYLPWRLSDGQILYRDVASLYGPLSPYLNALEFRLFGVSLTTVVFCNLAILAAMTGLVYRLLSAACDRLTATTSCLVLLLVFGFSQYVSVGNYNFVCPYSHEATHGVALTVAMIYCLSRVGRRQLLTCGLAGLCFGFVLLTRVEVAVAACAALLTWVVIRLLLRNAVPGFGWRGAAGFLAAAVAPLLGFFLYFALHLPVGHAARAVGGAYAVLATSRIADNAFFRVGMGLDDVRGNLAAMLQMCCLVAVAAVVAAIIDVLTRKWAKARTGLAVALAAGVLAASVRESAMGSWLETGRALPVISLGAWSGLLAMLVRRRQDSQSVVRLLPLVLWAAFATVLLAKMGIYARLHQYGFFLALPAAVLSVVALLWIVPGLLTRGVGGALVYQAVALAAILGGAASCARIASRVYAAKDFAVGAGGDRIIAFSPRVNPSALAVREILERIEREMPPAATFVALPEGVMLNYLSRRANPTPYHTFMMSEVLAFGEDNMLAHLRARPPDFVVLVHKNTAEFGVGLFGSDDRYGRRIMEWVDAEYQPLALVGAEPLHDPRLFGIKLLCPRP